MRQGAAWSAMATERAIGTELAKRVCNERGEGAARVLPRKKIILFVKPGTGQFVSSLLHLISLFVFMFEKIPDHRD